MTLEDIVEKLMDLDEDTCPCEVGIPCPFDQPASHKYCIEGNCAEAVASLIRSVVEK